MWVFEIQADICHAYQLLRKGGLKDENIVVFMYDDIAMHDMNPRPGIIINHPDGDDVYAGVPKVYILILCHTCILCFFFFSFTIFVFSAIASGREEVGHFRL